MNNNIMVKSIDFQNQWHQVAGELEKENIKLMSYDQTLIEQVETWQGKKVLDYGAGPGVLAVTLQRLGADVKAYDISLEMRSKLEQRVGYGNVYSSATELPKNYFDIIICNLVLCIVSEEEVENIMSNIRICLKPGGVAFIGFCNPKIHNVAESQLDFRFFSGRHYQENHTYKKIKKEGLYEIVETHRPVDWYSKVFQGCGLILLDIILTPEYKIRDQRINDFTIFKLEK
ncbi:MAG: class I SAM-dependent methyltransferase [Candidatus Doudnabacteria bacterium]|nr:class I SAM-dependent methyltransferase [Candidatus Doudnabacteria bacterium]